MTLVDDLDAAPSTRRLGVGGVFYQVPPWFSSSTECDEASLHDFEERVRRFPEVIECYTVTGSADYFLKIVTRDIKHYDRFLRRHLIQIPLVRDVSSNVAVTQIKYTTGLPLETQL